MTVLILILAHLVGDFYLQTDRMAASKQKYLIRHVLIHFVLYFCLLLVLYIWTLSVSRFLFQIALPSLILALSHYAIDTLKIRTTRFISGSQIGQAYLFLSDQILHFTVILLAGATFFYLPLSLFENFVAEMINQKRIPNVSLDDKILFCGIIIILATTFTGHLIRLLVGTIPEHLSLFEGKYTLTNSHGPLDQMKSQKPQPSFEEEFNYVVNKKGDRSRGKIIGYVERLLVIILIVSSSYASIGFIVAAKSIARFKQMDDRQFAEYFLLGTLTSIFFGMIYGFILRLVLF
ncbi:DUF3307 domain-containing protein [Sporolactobacillus shoreae]|uniref:DUF3307 domain-containing protein n=1 Tax=Sporolactobacillus shoreae TaxID=1465501 RepID=A0A4Z0GVY9_9BACL|nr:DUF3307 domain-containing protein [Sporolactobacillus shoreae]TGB00452.1 DUF3307 domain-containing protein [Sporolactobacillus shoreae]